MRSPVDKESPVVHGLRRTVRRAVLGIPEQAGFRLERLEDTSTFIDDRSTLTPQLMTDAVTVPGMISMRRGMYYYWLAYAGIPGNIIELGCWQGRSTTFLARACKDSGNGIVHSVDTFGGNPGNEAAYKVGADDLSDLESHFRANMDRLGLADHVRVHVGASVDVAPQVIAQAGSVRMLVVDADHTYDAVKGDLDAYADALGVGGLLVFDDYSTPYTGVAQAVTEHLGSTDRYCTSVQDDNLLVVRRVK